MSAADPFPDLDPALAARGDVARFWRVPRYSGLDCLAATFRRHSYVRHTHETYAIASIQAGCETFFHRGAQHYAGAGSVAVVCPDELHDGAPHGGGFVYRTFYPSAALMQDIAEEIADRPLPGPPWFPASVLPAPDLAAALARLLAVLGPEARGPMLAADGAVIGFLSALIARFAEGILPPRRPCNRGGVARARDYLDAHADEDVDLAALSRVAGLSRSHLIRAFRAETGLAPHAYLVDRRVRAACRRLAAGESPAEVAAACGFYDQSHLTRAFKARLGVMPGTFRAA
ncbi:AraC family transcriptional regulator [Methylobacterium sp. ID0610]|uniref:AraC family transcriptional regulator n=1 Tax=Methylobacterium carpenticola TaxID=3344827 RepID=UPI00368E49B0